MKFAILPALVILGVGVTDQEEKEESAETGYLSQEQCKLCHNKPSEGEQWEVWAGTAHAKAFETLKTEESAAIARRKGLERPPHEAPACLRCHVTGYDPAENTVPAKIERENGVQCESCHGPAEGHREYGFAVARAGDGEVSADPVVKRPGDEDCRVCHNPESPTWDPERYTLSDGSTAGFDFYQAFRKISHWIP